RTRMSDDSPETPSLTVQGGPIDGYDMKITQGTTVIIGSGRLASMRLDHPDIELAHVKVTWDDFGISMIDNGSRKGTWVNGEPVETTALLDGDVIEFVGPDSRSAPPKVKVRIPKGSVPEPPPPPPPTPEDLAARPAPEAPVRPAGPRARVARRRRSGPRLPDLRLVGVVAGALVLLAGGWWLTRRLFFTAPQVDSIAPAQGEPGETITITGERFDGDAEDNVVWFGDRSVTATSASHRTLQAKVPPGGHAGTVRVMVETGAGRSRPMPFVALAPLRAVSLDPAGARPGDEVAVNGSGFADGASVTVGGVAATVVSADAAALRFAMPEVRGAVGSLHPVVVSSGERRTKPLALYLGRVPLVASFEPARGVAGDLVRIRGAGFAAAPDGNVVTFDGLRALVVAASPTELAVAVPPARHAQPEALVPVVVHAGGKASDAVAFPLQRLVEGAWVPRFLAGAVGEEGAKGQATVGTEIAPVLLLSGKDESRSVGERALRVAHALNAAVDRARVGQAASFEAREQPAAGVALVGAPDLLVRATAPDAAAYETPPGLPARGAPPTPIALARHWAALLNDTLVVGTSGGKPAATAGSSPAAGAAFAQLRSALPWQYGSGLSSSRVVALSSDLKRRLREAAFRVP
ncbi:MAG TPA: IPT/TIG domain-containing protein, partial [Vicinamibacteria bacterium]|nr:IPT/TIG domain-containing protein [Vicinamibacteria bacterium]